MSLNDIENTKMALISTYKGYIENKEVLKALEDAFKAEHSELIERVSSLSAELNELEKALRSLVEQYYMDTGNKTPTDGVGVRHTKRVIYDEKEAIAWARQTGLALKLNTVEFEKLAKTSKDIDFVVIEEQAQATLSKKLYE